MLYIILVELMLDENKNAPSEKNQSIVPLAHSAIFILHSFVDTKISTGVPKCLKSWWGQALLIDTICPNLPPPLE